MLNETSTSALLRRAESAAPGGVHTSLRNVEPHLVVTRSAGQYLWDLEGNQYVDYHAAFGPIVLGHSYPAVNSRVISALAENDLYGVGTTPAEVELVEKLKQHIPSAELTLLCNSGSEATYHAIRVARAVTERPLVIKFQGCYHGWHDYVLRNALSTRELTGKRDPGSAGMLDAAIDSTLVCDFNDLDSVESALTNNRGEVAAIIIEPIAHNVGCLMPQPGFLEGLRSLSSDHEVVLIFDEVITGFRHSLGGFQALAGVKPDVTTIGKAMANGYPMAALTGRADVMGRFNTRPGGDVFFAGTFNGHTVGTVAALATIGIMEDEAVHKRLFRLGERMREGLSSIIDRLAIPAIVTGFGSVFTLYFLERQPVKYSDLLDNDGERYVAYRRAMIRQGIFEFPMNLKRSCISYSHTEADVDGALEVAESVLSRMASGLPV